jgi:hypothetical protein
MGDTGFSVNYPALEGVRQALEYTHASLKANLDQTAPGCTAVADAYPGWSTSAALRDLHGHYAARVTGHANDIAGYATDVQTAIGTYQAADYGVQGDVDSIPVSGGA